MILKYPVQITQSYDKIAFAYKAQETLRLAHNKKGEYYKNKTITKEEWETWLKDYFNPRSSAISLEIVKHKNSLKESTQYIVDLEDDFEES